MNHNTRLATLLTAVAVALVTAGFACAADQPIDLATWDKELAAFNGAKIGEGKATLTSATSIDWAFLLNKEDTADGELAATVTILEPAKDFRFFGQGWSAWPKSTLSDGGFEAALLLRSGKQPLTPVRLGYFSG